MTSTNDISFLQSYLKELQECYELGKKLTDSDLTNRPSTTPTKAERCARLADANKFDGSLYRNLFSPDTQAIESARMCKQIETIPRIIAKIETTAKVSATKLRKQPRVNDRMMEMLHQDGQKH